MCLKLIPWVTPLNAGGNLNCKGATHGTDPMGLLGGEVGLEKNTNSPTPKNEFCNFFFRSEFEAEHGDDDSQVSVSKLMPKRVKRRRKAVAAGGNF